MFFCVKTTMSGKVPTDQQRQAHREYLRDHSFCLLAAGPTFEEGSDSPEGSIFLIEASDFASARAFIEGDPFFRFGMRGKVDIYAWRPGGYARTFPISASSL